jgi:hypothetical protein
MFYIFILYELVLPFFMSATGIQSCVQVKNYGEGVEDQCF